MDIVKLAREHAARWCREHAIVADGYLAETLAAAMIAFASAAITKDRLDA